MDDIGIARMVHVLAIVLWIGGVAFVTTVVLPSVRRLSDASEAVRRFEEIEHRFAWQARVLTVAAVLSGLYMAHRLDAWHRFANIGDWWLHAMVLVWALYSFVLFVAEPLFLSRWFSRRAAAAPRAMLALAARFHWALLIFSLATIAAGILGARGML